MPLRLLILYSLLCLTGGIMAEAPPDPDYAYSKHLTFTIAEKRDAYRLQAKTEIDAVYLTKRATEDDTHYFTEAFYAKVKKVKARLGKKKIKGGSIAYWPADSRDVFLSDDFMHGIKIPHEINPGDTFHFSYEEEYIDIAYLPRIIIPNYDFIDHYTVDYVHPDTVTLDFEFFFPRDSIPVHISRSPERTVVTIDALPEAKDLPYFAYNDMQAAILVTVRVGDRRLTPTAIDEFSTWYGQLTSLEPAFDSAWTDFPDLPLADAATTLDTLKAIHDYIRENVRYISDVRELGAIAPHNPGVVLERKYGDCKDRASLAAAFARRYGIPVHMALVNVNPRPMFSGVHVWQFDHVICAYDAPGGAVFFDPTQRYLAFGKMIEPVIDADALILDPAAPRRQRIVAEDDSPGLDVAITADLDSPDRGSARITLAHDYAMSAVFARENLTGAKLENRLDEIITANLYKIALTDFTYVDQTDTTISFTADADLSKFIIASPTKRYLPRTALVIVDGDILERGDDRYPLYFDRRQHIRCRLDLTLGEYRLRDDTPELFADSAGYFHITATGNGSGHAVIEYVFHRPARQLTGSVRTDYLDFCRTYLDGKTAMLILEKGE